MIRETWGTSKPRAQTSVEIRTRLKHKIKSGLLCNNKDLKGVFIFFLVYFSGGPGCSHLGRAYLAPDLNSFMMDSLSF